MILKKFPCHFEKFQKDETQCQWLNKEISHSKRKMYFVEMPFFKLLMIFSPNMNQKNNRVKWKWPKVRHICKGSFFGMQDKNLKGLITLKLNFTTNPTLLSMGWVNLCPEASIMPDIYQITCCAYNGSWNDESLINMQTYQVGFDRVSTVRKAKNRTLFIIFVLL